MKIYLVETYRDFIERMVFKNQHVRGYKSRLAEAAGCHSSYVSQVLKGEGDLTLEQALNLAHFWGLDAEETDFLLDLLLRDRAGNQKLRQFYESRIQQARQTRDPLGSNGSNKKDLDADVAAVYFSSWHFSAVHLLAMTEDFRSPERMASRLRLPVPIVKEALRQLESFGIIVRQGERWQEAEGETNLPRQHIFTTASYSNWRQRALYNLQSRDPDSLHLQELATIRKSDFICLKAVLVEALEKFRMVTEQSEREEGICLTVDLFRI